MKIVIVTCPNEGLKETGFGLIHSCRNVLESIIDMGYSAALKVCRTEYELELIVRSRPDLVILAVKYLSIRDRQNIWLSEFFNSNGINYSGSSREVLSFDSDKIAAKRHLLRENVKTARFFTALPREYKNKLDLPLNFPLFLKPSDAANGSGIDDSSLVLDFKSYEKKILSIYKVYQQPILVEEYLSGREFTVAIIEKVNKELVVSAIEIVPLESSKGLRILGAKAKSENSEVLLKINDLSLIKEIKDLAVDAFRKLGGRDYGRIDVKLNENNECFFIEANLVPGMTATSSYFPRACHLDLDLNYDQVIKLLINQGLNRISTGISKQEQHA